MERTCVGCRAQAPAAQLVRVACVDGVATLDAERRLPGRGAHLHPTRDCLELALRRRALPRALRVAPLATDGLAADPRFA